MASRWFLALFGQAEHLPAPIKDRFLFDEATGVLTSLANQRRQFQTGHFHTPSLADLRLRVKEEATTTTSTLIKFRHARTGDALPLHRQNPNSCFQVASQFNCLEFPQPHALPSDGITQYAQDMTQGPACSLACASSTLVRNYFAGQSDEAQFNNLVELEEYLGGVVGEYITVENGYVNSTPARMQALNAKLLAASKEDLASYVRVGWHRQCQIVFADRTFEPLSEEEVLMVSSQVFCSAISCAYAAEVRLRDWEPLAQLVLDAAYEATLLCAYLDKIEGQGNGKVFLTLLGGGVFGNEPEWIARAIARALHKCRHLDLDVTICHYAAVDRAMESMVASSYAKM